MYSGLPAAHVNANTLAGDVKRYAQESMGVPNQSCDNDFFKMRQFLKKGLGCSCLHSPYLLLPMKCREGGANVHRHSLHSKKARSAPSSYESTQFAELAALFVR